MGLASLEEDQASSRARLASCSRMPSSLFQMSKESACGGLAPEEVRSVERSRIDVAREHLLDLGIGVNPVAGMKILMVSDEASRARGLVGQAERLNGRGLARSLADPGIELAPVAFDLLLAEKLIARIAVAHGVPPSTSRG